MLGIRLSRLWRPAVISLLGGLLLVLVLAFVVILPRWLYPSLTGAELDGIAPDRRVELRTDRLKLQVDTRTSILQALGG